MRYIFCTILLITCGLAHAQIRTPLVQKTVHPAEKPAQKDTIKKPRLEVRNKPLAMHSEAVGNTHYRVADSVKLEKVIILGSYKFANRAERHRYLLLRRRTKEVWPYAVLAADRLATLRERLGDLDSKRAKRQYTRIVRRYFEDKFKERLKNLTKSEGQILVKLLYRQTGQSTYEIIRDLRSGWSAFWDNAKAGLFSISLREEYDPMNNKEDYFIEHILRRGFQSGKLEYQQPAIPIDFSRCMDKWK